MSKYIIAALEISSDSDRGNFDKEKSNEENSDEENLKNIRIVKLMFKAYV